MAKKKKKKCPCCGKYFDPRGYKVHIIFCCTTNAFTAFDKADSSKNSGSGKKDAGFLSTVWDILKIFGGDDDEI